MANRIRKKNIVEFDQVSQRFIIEAMIMCDTESDLPTADEFDNYHIAQGSLAVVVETSDRFRITSDGTWEKMTSGSGSSPSFVKKEITENGTYNATDDSADGFYSVVVDVPQSGGGSTTATRKDVNFYDYDGTIVYSYTKDEFASLTAMPDNPSHEGLTAQGWNWSLSDAKTYVSSYNKLNIGQMYVTSDGKTRLYITLTEGRTSPILKLTLASDSEVDVDWGDGTAHETLSGSGDTTTNRHDYTAAGSYIIAITVNSGSITIPQYVLSDGNSSTSSPDKAYINAIKKIEVGSSVTSIESNAFQSCSSLSSITIPSSVTSIGVGAFSSCYSLSNITIPSSVTSIRDSAFTGCASLSTITIPSSVTSIGSYAFSSCYPLNTITIPSSVTSIGTNAFQYCYSLSSITIPSSVTSIGIGVFQNCYSINTITIPSSVTSIGINAFTGCASLSTITIPSSVTSIGSYAFQYCYSLSSITINKPEGSISGSPWGAKTSAPTNTQIVWTG